MQNQVINWNVIVTQDFLSPPLQSRIPWTSASAAASLSSANALRRSRRVRHSVVSVTPWFFSCCCTFWWSNWYSLEDISKGSWKYIKLISDSCHFVLFISYLLTSIFCDRFMDMAFLCSIFNRSTGLWSIWDHIFCMFFVNEPLKEQTNLIIHFQDRSSSPIKSQLTDTDALDTHRPLDISHTTCHSSLRALQQPFSSPSSYS